MQYRDEINGLRALSFIFVFLFHIGSAIFPGGYLGVDAFFVISGYVITQSLYSDYSKNNSINILNFFIRRFKRIVPALSLMLFSTFIVYIVFYNLKDLKEIFYSFASSIFAVSNFIYFKFSKDYFLESFDNLYLHTWSLGVEEQFYFIYPLLLIILLKTNKKIIFLISLISLYIFSIFNSKSLPFNEFLFDFYSPYLRIFEFFFGCVGFYIYNFKKNFIFYRSFFSNLSILAIILILFFNNYLNNLYLEIFLISFFVASLLIFFKETFLSKIFFIPGITYLGKISYGMYLWHFPIIFFFKDLIVDKFQLFFVAFFLTFLIASISFKYFEKPILKIKNENLILKTFSPILIISAIILIFTIFSNSKFNTKIKIIYPHIEHLAFKVNMNVGSQYIKNHSHIKSFTFNDIKATGCSSGDLSINFVMENCYFRNNSNNLLFIIGDSLANAFLPTVYPNHKKYEYDLINLSLPGGVYAQNIRIISKKNFNSKNFEYFKAIDNHVNLSLNVLKKVADKYDKITIILGQDFQDYFNEEVYLNLDDNLNIIKSENLRIKNYIVGLKDFTQKFNLSNVKFLILKDYLEPKFDLENCYGKNIDENKECEYFSYTQFNKKREILNLVLTEVSRQKNVKIYDPTQNFCNDQKCNLEFKKNYLSMLDRAHPTVEFSKFIRNDFFLQNYEFIFNE